MSRIKQTATVALAMLLIVSSVVSFTGVALAAPNGMVTTPSSNINEDLPGYYEGELRASDLEGNVMASKHADTLEVTLTTPKKAKQSGKFKDANAVSEGPFALILRDDVNHAGREVALPAAPIRNELGHVPKQITGYHEDVGAWSNDVRLEDGYIVFKVPHFSSSLVTFSGEVNLTGNPAADGSSYTYDITEPDAVDNYTIQLTGATATERDTVSTGGLSNGDTMALNVAGTKAATNAEVTFTGVTQTTSRTPSGSFSTTTGGSDSISVGGNIEPTGPASGSEPRVTLSGTRLNGHYNEGSYNDVSSSSFSRVVPAPMDTINQFRLGVQRSTNDGDCTTDVLLNGTNVGTMTIDASTNSGTLTGFTYDASTMENVEAKMNHNCGDGLWFRSGSRGTMDTYSPRPSSFSVNADSGASASIAGTSGSAAIDLKTSTSSVDVSASSGEGSISYDLEYTERTASSNPAIDADGDGANDASYSGMLTQGQTATYSLGELSTGSGPASFALNSGVVDAEVSYTEYTETVDPTVEVNNQTASYTGTLADGSTANLTTDPAWVQSGTNRVNVTVGDGTLSADAPQPQTGFEYSHRAQDKQSVDYVSKQWSESYNVSHTYADETASASTTIPFDSTRVVDVSTVEKQINDGSWQTVSSSNYRFDGTELTVEHGDIASNTKVEVRATGRKVSVHNGSINVLDPSAPGEALDTQFEVSSWASGAYIEVSGTQEGNRLHYTYNESWSEPDEHAEVRASGKQRVVIPNAASGGRARMTTMPLEVNPDTNEVLVGVDRAGSTPLLDVDQGARSGDEVTFVWHRTQTGTEYVLQSVTNDVTRDTGVAESPVSLTDDDSNELLKIFVAGSGGSTSDSGGGGDSGEVTIPTGGGSGGITVGSSLFVVLALALLTGMWYISNRFGSGSISTRTYVGLGAALLLVLSLEVLSPASIMTGIVKFLAGASTAWPLIVIAVAALGYYYLKQRGKPEKVINFALGRGGK